MLSVAPKNFKIGFKNTKEIIMMTAPTDKLLYKVVLAILTMLRLCDIIFTVLRLEDIE